MNVFVAGATGAVGRPLVAQLLTAGHTVTGLTRSAASAEHLRSVGTAAHVGDALDRGVVMRAVSHARPDVIVNQLTNLSQRSNAPDAGQAFAATNALRRTGTTHLLEAAVANGVRQIISQSVAFYYAGGAGLAREDEPFVTPDFQPLIDVVAALEQCERQSLMTPGLVGTVLRYGFLHGPGTAYSEDGELGTMVRFGRLPVISDSPAQMSLVHVDDAARAVVSAIDAGVAGAFNVVDDEPASWSQVVTTLAARRGAPAPPTTTAARTASDAGPFASFIMTQLRGASNRKAKETLRLTLQHPRWSDEI